MSVIEHTTKAERAAWALDVLRDKGSPLGRRLVADQLLRDFAAEADQLAGAVAALREIDSLLSMQIESGNALSLDGQRELREMVATALGGQ